MTQATEPGDPPPLTNADWRRFVKRAWQRRCPRCGSGALFERRFRLAQSCSDCDLVFRREAGAMTGQMYLTAVVTEILAALLVLAIFFGTDWGTGLSIAVAVPLVLGFSYWFLPRGMALWVAVEFMTDVGNREPWVRGGPRP